MPNETLKKQSLKKYADAVKKRAYAQRMKQRIEETLEALTKVKAARAQRKK